MAAPALAPATANTREVLKCLCCRLVQFVTHDRNCRRCHVCLDPIPEPPPAPVPVPERPQFASVSAGLPATIRSLRLSCGLSQRELARRLSVPRTWVSKAENLKCTPTLTSLERIARALNVPMRELVSAPEHARRDEIRVLAADPFVAELMRYLPQLGNMQRRAILAQVNSLTLRRRA